MSSGLWFLSPAVAFMCVLPPFAFPRYKQPQLEAVTSDGPAKWMPSCQAEKSTEAFSG